MEPHSLKTLQHTDEMMVNSCPVISLCVTSLLELIVSVFPGCVVCVYGGSEWSNNSVKAVNRT